MKKPLRLQSFCLQTFNDRVGHTLDDLPLPLGGILTLHEPWQSLSEFP
jgi:hypothetical protein